jgi:hypothetical protein
MIYTVFINLDERVDRFNLFTETISPYLKIFGTCHRQSGIKFPLYPPVGCLKAHILALTNFLCYSDDPYIAIFEDDFKFTSNPDKINDWINVKSINGQLWDVIMLHGTYAIHHAEVIDDLVKIIECQSAAGYIVRRDYVSKLISCLSKNLTVFEKLASITINHINKKRIIDCMYNDQSWKELQRLDNWFLAIPNIGCQRPSYSNLEMCHVDYGDKNLNYLIV